jgi:hypothetical protein
MILTSWLNFVRTISYNSVVTAYSGKWEDAVQLWLWSLNGRKTNLTSMLTLRCFMVLSIKIDLEAILWLTLFREAHKHDSLVIFLSIVCISIMFLGCTKLFLCKSVLKKMSWFQFFTGMKLEKMKSYIHGTMMSSKLQPFCLCEASCTPIMWKTKNNKKWCSKAREVEILETD